MLGHLTVRSTTFILGLVSINAFWPGLGVTKDVNPIFMCHIDVFDLPHTVILIMFLTPTNR